MEFDKGKLWRNITTGQEVRILSFNEKTKTVIYGTIQDTSFRTACVTTATMHRYWEPIEREDN